MINNWEEIPRDEFPRGSYGIHVTLNPKGVIRLSRATHQMLGSPTAFKLFYDKANCRIGLKAADPKQRNAYPAGVGKCGAKVIRAFRLMRTHNLNLSAAIEFQDARIDEHGILVLDLRTAKASKRVRK